MARKKVLIVRPIHVIEHHLSQCWCCGAEDVFVVATIRPRRGDWVGNLCEPCVDTLRRDAGLPEKESG
jgi:hypothetical protein